MIALSACLAGEVQRNLARGMYEEAVRAAGRYVEIFGKDNFFLELQDHGLPDQRLVNQGLMRMSRRQAWNWWLPMISITPLPRMRRPMIFCCASRPAKGGG